MDVCCKIQAVASLSNCFIAFVIASLLRSCTKKALTWGVLQVTVRVHGGVHDVRAWLVNTKRLQTQNRCVFPTSQTEDGQMTSSWTSGTINWFWVSLLILFSKCNSAFTRIDMGLCNVGLTSCWEGHGCFVPTSHMSSHGQHRHYTFTHVGTQWGKQWTAWMSVSRWSALLFCTFLSSFVPFANFTSSVQIEQYSRDNLATADGICG